MQLTADYLIIGGGIAGASAAYRLAGFGRKVILIDAEAKSPYHASARSAALGDEIYTPNEDIAALTKLGSKLMKNIKGARQPKGSLHVYGEPDFDLCEETYSNAIKRGVKVEMLGAEQLTARFPYLRLSSQHCAAGLYLAPGEAYSIDVNALFSQFKVRFRAMEGETLNGQKLLSASYGGGAWTVTTNTGTIRAGTLINAAGAWADEVAERCGVEPKGMTAYRRNVLVSPIRKHPALLGQGGPFIFWDSRKEDLYCDIRSDGQVLISPADEDPSAPCDAQADGYSIGLASARLEERTSLELTHGDTQAWAGLRTFMPDRRPLIGWDPDAPAFFWSAAYGGFGIETCLASSMIVAAEILGDVQLKAELEVNGISRFAHSVNRLRPSRVRCR
jgi:D-arginine dehydrogenase